MAAGILLYDADLVPVGEDQKQHLELARDIAQQRINARYAPDPEHPILKVPEPLILKEGARVMSLTDGSAKMSKSDPNEGSRITLLDPPELITRKIKRAKTDPVIGLEFGNPERPEADNLLGLYALLSGLGRERAAADCASMGWGAFKPLLAEATVEALRPLQQRYADLRSDPAILEELKEQNAAIEGNRGAKMWAVNVETGEQSTGLDLTAPPVWDGIISANGQIFISTVDGKLQCFGK
jgi:tryptophanyl-tRNA synthetase